MLFTARASDRSIGTERYRWLRENFTPVGHIGYSYLLFRVTPERLREVLAGGGPPR